jgi:hypothetical protein
MTKKELTLIVDGIVSAVILKATEYDENGIPRSDQYEPTAADCDEGRTLVGIALKRNRAAILASIPVFAPMASSVPVATVAPASELASSLVLPF